MTAIARLDTRPSIRTPFNPRRVRSTLDTRRVLRNGRWVRPDPQAGATLRWLRSQTVEAPFTPISTTH